MVRKKSHSTKIFSFFYSRNLVFSGVCKAAEVGAHIKSQLQFNFPTEPETEGLFPSRTTLIVLPPAFFFHWVNKLKRDGCHLRVFSYIGSQNVIISLKELAGFDVVVTTYAIVSKEMPEDRPLYYHPTRLGLNQLKNVYWMRIILIKPEQISNPRTNDSQAVCQLSARHRWAIAESPFNTKRGLFSSICTFLRVTPFNDPDVIDNLIGLKKICRDGNKRLDVLFEALIFNPKGPATPGGKEIVPIQLSLEERNLYDKALAFAQTKLQKELKRSSADRAYRPGEYSEIFAIFLRLRQLCVLPYLFYTKFPTPEASINLGSILGFRETHVFYKNFLSSKIIQLLKDLEELRTTATETARPMQKIVIVTVCSETLNVILEHLVERQFSVVCLTKLTEWKTFLKNQEEFNEKRYKPQIYLINSNCYREQLSLPAAKHLFFIEPHWNPEWELQLEGVVGEPKTLHIKRFVTIIPLKLA